MGKNNSHTVELHDKMLQGDHMRFKRVYIEITNSCNLQCSFCVQNQRTPRRMRIEEFQYILHQVRPYTDYIYLHVLGEPLSHPELNQILALCETVHMNVNITTNGTLLKQKQDILLQHSLRQLNVSLHSFPQHEQPHYLEDVFAVCEALAKHHTYINYRLWSIQNDTLTASCKAILDVLCDRYHYPLNEQDIQRLHRISLADHISLHFEDIFEWPSLQQPYVGEVGRCHGMKDMCAILVNGDVVPCCLDGKGECVLGNIYQTPLETIIQNELSKKILEGFQKQIVTADLCKHCSYRLRFSKHKR